VSYFGVRRQSAAATALWIDSISPESRANPKRCRAALATALQIKTPPYGYPMVAKLYCKKICCVDC
jgi:hypothetical protein